MEDGGVHPLLPIPKHDPQMILKLGEIGRPAAAGTEWCVCHTDTVGSVNMHCSRVCVSVELNQPKTLKLSIVFVLRAQGVCVCVCVTED